MKLSENHILDLFISVPIRDMKKKIHNVILLVSISYSSKYRPCTPDFTKTVSLWKWSNTLFRFMIENMGYTPHAFNLTFLKNSLEFWTEIFRAIFLNMRAHMMEVSSKSEMVTWRLFWKLGHLSRNDPIASQNIFVIKN